MALRREVQRREVAEVAPGVYAEKQFHAQKLVPGDEIMYGRYSGIEFEHGNETLLIVRYPDILAVYPQEG